MVQKLKFYLFYPIVSYLFTITRDLAFVQFLWNFCKIVQIYPI